MANGSIHDAEKKTWGNPEKYYDNLHHENERFRGLLRRVLEDAHRHGHVRSETLDKIEDDLDETENGQDFPTLLGFGPDDIKDLEADRDRFWEALTSIDGEISDSGLTRAEKIRRTKAVLNRMLHSGVPTPPEDGIDD